MEYAQRTEQTSLSNDLLCNRATCMKKPLCFSTKRQPQLNEAKKSQLKLIHMKDTRTRPKLLGWQIGAKYPKALFLLWRRMRDLLEHSA